MKLVRYGPVGKERPGLADSQGGVRDLSGHVADIGPAELSEDGLAFGPVGPWLVTKDEVGDVQTLDMWLDLNGTRMQTGDTKTMIFGVARLVSYVSGSMTLKPGDIITTGTPPGVGLGHRPQPLYLKPGDRLRLGIDKLGEQRQTFIEWNSAQ